jgi:hypothetical protein
MELTYKVLGADGKEYGPVSLTDLNTWLREGRITGETQVTRSDIDYWCPAAQFTELEVPPAAASAAVPVAVAVPGAQPVAVAAQAAPVAAQPAAGRLATPVAKVDPAAEAQLRSGASWFYWIAGLLLINSVVALTGSEWGFILGLGLTQVFDAIGQNLGGGGKMVVFVLDVLAAGLFVFFGVFANKGKTWSFVVGMILYALDGLIFLFVQDWLSLGFHVLALYFLFRGFQACRALKAG